MTILWLTRPGDKISAFFDSGTDNTTGKRFSLVGKTVGKRFSLVVFRQTIVLKNIFSDQNHVAADRSADARPVGVRLY